MQGWLLVTLDTRLPKTIGQDGRQLVHLASPMELDTNAVMRGCIKIRSLPSLLATWVLSLSLQPHGSLDSTARSIYLPQLSNVTNRFVLVILVRRLPQSLPAKSLLIISEPLVNQLSNAIIINPYVS